MIIGIDTETYPIVEVGKATKKTVPRLVCLSWAQGEESGVLAREESVTQFLAWLEDPSISFALVNAPYEMLGLYRAVFEETGRDILAEIFGLYEDGRILDVSVRAQLNDIEEGRGIFGAYGLDGLAKRFLGVKIENKKGDWQWRLRYNELDGVPVEKWPEAAYEYARLDAVRTLELEAATTYHGNEKFQVGHDFWLSLTSAWGLRVDPDWADRIDAFYAREEARWKRRLEDLGCIVGGVVKQAIKRDLVEAAWAAIGEEPKLTDKGGIKTDRKVLDYLGERFEHFEIPEDDETLRAFQAYLGYSRASKLRSTYMDPILDAYEGPLCPRFNVLVDTGRTSSSKPNVQNFPSRTTNEEDAAMLVSEGKLAPEDFLANWPEGPWSDLAREGRTGFEVITGPDIRGCFVPRPGKVFVACDYKSAEAAGLAQVLVNLFGQSNMADAINEGRDLNLMVAAQIMGLEYEEAERRKAEGDKEVKKMRQAGKAAIYGFPGGASPRTWVDYAAGYGVRFSERQAQEVHAAWLGAFPEMTSYFAWISDRELGNGKYLIEQHGPNGATSGWRTRLCRKYTAACNTYFQGLVADGAKYSGWNISKACYLDDDSVLFGSRIVLFVHDEFVLEVDKEVAEEAGAELSRLMVEGMQVFLPDVKVEAEPEIQEKRWAK